MPREREESQTVRHNTSSESLKFFTACRAIYRKIKHYSIGTFLFRMNCCEAANTVAMAITSLSSPGRRPPCTWKKRGIFTNRSGEFLFGKHIVLAIHLWKMVNLAASERETKEELKKASKHFVHKMLTSLC